MTLQNLLSETTYEDFLEIAKLWSEKQPEWEAPLKIEKAAVAIQSFCEMLTTLDAEPSNDVLVALRMYDDGEEQVSAELFRRAEFYEKVKGLAAKTPPTFSASDSRARLTKIYEEMQEWTPQAYGYEFSRWEEILGAEVYPENYNHVGKLAFIAAALYELSFNGFTREEQEKRREELDKSIREADEISALPEEEREKHYHTLEELQEKWGFEDTRMEQEKEEDYRKMMLDCVKTRMAWEEELQRMSRWI